MTINDRSRRVPYPTPSLTPPYDSPVPLTVLVSTRAVIFDNEDNLVLSPATITISPHTGTIISILPTILPPSSFPADTLYVNHSPYVLMPGLVDAHVHLNEPGRTEWEGFWTGTRAAASGGVTTVVDMPLNAIPPTTTIEGLQEKIKAAQGQCWVDVGFYGGIIPGNADQLLPLVEAGVRGFKGFLIESGVDEFPAVSSSDVALAMTTLKDIPTTLMFHAEMIPPITNSVGDDVQTSLPPLSPTGPLNSYATFLDSRPPAFETYAIEEILSLAHLAPSLHLHIVHLSAIEALPILRKARSEGVKITAETCFHYLALAAEEVQDGDTRHKCCPPIRSAVNRDGLWDELNNPDSVIQTIVSDHSPCTPELKLLPEHLQNKAKGCCGGAMHAKVAHGHIESEKEEEMVKGVNGELLTRAEADEQERGDFFASWGGISSVGLGLPILWTEATARSSSKSTTSSSPSTSSSLSLLDIARLCALSTASQVGLSHRKGSLRPGMDADICVFDPEGTWVVGREQLLFRNKVSPYQGRTMRGVVKETWVRGGKVFERGGSEGGFVTGIGSGKGMGGPRGELLLERRV